jgi:hypothetical protein
MALTKRPNRVYAALILLGAVATAALLTIYFYQDATGQNAIRIEIAKGLIQFITIGLIGAVIKFLFDSYQEDQRRLAESRERVRQRQASLNDFRSDKIRRLVQVTNALRRAPILIDAHRSAKSYNEQMRALLDAGLELRLIRHEIDAIGPDETNAAFPNWPSIRAVMHKMEDYLVGVQKDFRSHSKQVSEFQLVAERDRNRQGEVWEAIRQIPSVIDLLSETDARSQTSGYYQQYFLNYQTVITGMLRASLQPDNLTSG